MEASCPGMFLGLLYCLYVLGWSSRSSTCLDTYSLIRHNTIVQDCTGSCPSGRSSKKSLHEVVRYDTCILYRMQKGADHEMIQYSRMCMLANQRVLSMVSMVSIVWKVSILSIVIVSPSSISLLLLLFFRSIPEVYELWFLPSFRATPLQTQTTSTSPTFSSPWPDDTHARPYFRS